MFCRIKIILIYMHKSSYIYEVMIPYFLFVLISLYFKKYNRFLKIAPTYFGAYIRTCISDD